MTEVGCDAGFLWGENMFEQSDVRTVRRRWKANGKSVQMLLKFSVRAIVIMVSPPPEKAGDYSHLICRGRFCAINHMPSRPDTSCPLSGLMITLESDVCMANVR